MQVDESKIDGRMWNTVIGICSDSDGPFRIVCQHRIGLHLCSVASLPSYYLQTMIFPVSYRCWLKVPIRVPLAGEELKAFREEENRKRRLEAEEEEQRRQAAAMEKEQVGACARGCTCVHRCDGTRVLPTGWVVVDPLFPCFLPLPVFRLHALLGDAGFG